MGEYIITGAIVGILSLAIIVMSVFMLKGRGADMIAGYNTKPKEEKEQYDSVGLSKFMGKIMLCIGVLTPVAAIAEMNHVPIVTIICVAIMAVLIAFAIIYTNTKNRFKK